jgi:FKBP-type peptidyl-prolyl cis-trans isomerase FkpA
MKRTVYPLFVLLIFGLFSIMGLPSCRKDKFQPNIHQYDSIQIQNYIAANHLTGFRPDTVNGDTSGIWYRLADPGSGTPLQYSSQVTFVFTERSFDGKYALTDTIQRHFYDYVGHVQTDGLTLGLQLAIHDVLKYPNATMRVLIPSHLAFGIDGTGTGSSEVANSRIAGNQCLDFYVHAVNNFGPYDDLVIRHYMADSSLTGYSETADSIYYKVLTPGATNDPITQLSSITCTYTGQLLDGVVFDGAHNGTNSVVFPMLGFATPGNAEVLEASAEAGTKISILLPSKQAYGINGNSSGGIPPFSCLRFTWQVIDVTP